MFFGESLSEIAKFWMEDWVTDEPKLECVNTMREWGKAVKNRARHASELELFCFLDVLKDVECLEEAIYIRDMLRDSICGDLVERVKSLETSVSILVAELGDALPNSITVKQLIKFKGGHV